MSLNPHYVVENEISEDEFFLSQLLYLYSRVITSSFPCFEEELTKRNSLGE